MCSTPGDASLCGTPPIGGVLLISTFYHPDPLLTLAWPACGSQLMGLNNPCISRAQDIDNDDNDNGGGGDTAVDIGDWVFVIQFHFVAVLPGCDPPASSF